MASIAKRPTASGAPATGTPTGASTHATSRARLTRSAGSTRRRRASSPAVRRPSGGAGHLPRVAERGGPRAARSVHARQGRRALERHVYPATRRPPDAAHPAWGLAVVGFGLPFAPSTAAVVLARTSPRSSAAAVRDRVIADEPDRGRPPPGRARRLRCSSRTLGRSTGAARHCRPVLGRLDLVIGTRPRQGEVFGTAAPPRRRSRPSGPAAVDSSSARAHRAAAHLGHRRAPSPSARSRLHMPHPRLPRGAPRGAPRISLEIEDRTDDAVAMAMRRRSDFHHRRRLADHPVDVVADLAPAARAAGLPSGSDCTR